MFRRTLHWTLPLLLSAGVASAQDPLAQIEVKTWRLDRDHDRGGLDLGGRFDLNDEIRLEGYASTTGAAQLAYGELTWGDVRLGGGALGDDGALHLGYRPTFVARPCSQLIWRTSVDLAIGAGFLANSSGHDWGADVYAGTVALRSELLARPLDRVELTLGIYGDATVAVGPAGAEPLLEAGVPLTERLDVSLLGALSQGAVGSWGEIELLVLGSRRREGLSVTLGYREAWDWIHLDPTATVLSKMELLEDLSPGATPVRATRTLALEVGGGWGTGRLRLGVDVQHVRRSTTSLNFADRNGWSLGARIEGEAGVVRGSLTARHHLQKHPLESYWGDLPRTQVIGELGALLYETDSVAIRMIGAGRYTVEDTFGLPRKGYAYSAALTISFGGEGPRILGKGQPVLSLRTPREPPGGGLLQRLLSSDRTRMSTVGGDGSSLEVSKQELITLEARLRELSAESNIDLATTTPGAAALAVLRARRPALAVGYGRRGVQLSTIRRASRHAVLKRFEVPASEHSVLTRWDPPEASNLTAELRAVLEGQDLSSFSSGGVESLSLFVPRSRRFELAYQGRSAWGRFMRKLLSGR